MKKPALHTVYNMVNFICQVKYLRFFKKIFLTKSKLCLFYIKVIYKKMDNIEDEFIGIYDEEKPKFNGVENDIDSFIASLNIPISYCLVDFDISEYGILGDNYRKVVDQHLSSSISCCVKVIPTITGDNMIVLLDNNATNRVIFPIRESTMFKDCKRAETIALVHWDDIVASYRI